MRKTLLITLFVLVCTTQNYLFAEDKDSEIASRKTTVKEEEKKPYEGRTYKKNAFGLDLGIGGISDDSGLDETGLDFGVRYMHYFCPYVGADFFKFKTNIGFGTTDGVDHFIINPQLMTGIRGSSPSFAKNKMHVFSAFKFGLGATIFNVSGYSTDETYSGVGFCYEFEIGIHLTRTLFLAYAYNHQGGTVTGSGNDRKLDVGNNYSALRIGFNFGANTPYNK